MARLTSEQTALATRLGHDFATPDLLIEALTHASLSSRGPRRDNQRLEFLGDRVLGLVVAEALLDHDPNAVEGQLAPRLNALVRKETCAEVAVDIALGAALMMGKAESAAGGRKRTAMLGDAMEAVIAAVYLDAGYTTARDLVLRLWGKRIATAEARAADPKTSLQEWAQARAMPPPDYLDISRDGPDHAPVFTVEARLESGQSERASARSKRAAQTAAAEALLARVEASDD